MAFSLSLLIAATACAAPKATPPASQAKPNASIPAASQPQALNSVAQAAANAGVRSCLPTIEKIGNFATANTRNRAYVFLPATNADQQVTSASYELELPNKAIAYATMTTAPTKDGNCDALYETVTYWSGACADVAAKGYPQAKLAGALQQQILMLQGAGNVRIFLMPAGTQGCVAIKKEVVF